MTQQDFGGGNKQYIDYDAIERCVIAMDNSVRDWGVAEIGMPRIGAGLGGGDWDRIEDIIVRSAKNFIPVVYTL
jgi:O-acetyl-ADP-ribose deacetylase (regulator of RNase III)